MNFLLRDLKAAGTMMRDCIAFSDESKCEHIRDRFPGRPIFHMGTGVTPGPFWSVHAIDQEALRAAGYRLAMEAQGQPAPSPPPTT